MYSIMYKFTLWSSTHWGLGRPLSSSPNIWASWPCPARFRRRRRPRPARSSRPRPRPLPRPHRTHRPRYTPPEMIIIFTFNSIINSPIYWLFLIGLNIYRWLHSCDYCNILIFTFNSIINSPISWLCLIGLNI